LLVQIASLHCPAVFEARPNLGELDLEARLADE
jgi:hypothetical protein